jgi:hypothetical protein
MQLIIAPFEKPSLFHITLGIHLFYGTIDDFGSNLCSAAYNPNGTFSDITCE